MLSCRTFLAILVLLLCEPSLCSSQEGPSESPSDSVASDVFVMQKSPWSATWRSMVLPGWGQYYVEDYWKVPILLAATGFFAYNMIDNHNLFIENCDLATAAEAQGETNLADFYIRRQEFFRDRRDEQGFYLLVVYLVNIIDAYVGAHVYDFDVGEDLSGGLYVTPPGRVGFALRW